MKLLLLLSIGYLIIGFILWAIDGDYPMPFVLWPYEFYREWAESRKEKKDLYESASKWSRLLVLILLVALAPTCSASDNPRMQTHALSEYHSRQPRKFRLTRRTLYTLTLDAGMIAISSIAAKHALSQQAQSVTIFGPGKPIVHSPYK